MKLGITTDRVLVCLLLTVAVSLGTARAAEPQPALAPPVVREGDLAIALADRLGLAGTTDETTAEYALAGAGITPANGWIADYPVTPEIAADIHATALEAASSGALALTPDAVTHQIDNVFLSFGLPAPGPASDYSESVPEEWTDESPAYDPSEIERYYEDEGPPVVTYAPPPEDYAPLYSYVPSPFWWDGFGFGGFFILNDFHKVVDRHRHSGKDRHHRKRFVSNHVRDHRTGDVRRVEPAVRGTERLNRDSPRVARVFSGRSSRGGLASTGSGRTPVRDTRAFQNNRGPRAAREARVNLGNRPGLPGSARLATQSQGSVPGFRDAPRSLSNSGSRSFQGRMERRQGNFNGGGDRSRFRSNRGGNFQGLDRGMRTFRGDGGSTRFGSRRGGFEGRSVSGSSGFGGRSFSRGGSSGGRSGFSGGRGGFSGGRGGGGCRGRC